MIELCTELFLGFQEGWKKLRHYLDDVSGCGQLIESNLQKCFFDVLERIADLMRESTVEDYTEILLNGFQCQFRARDFSLLTEKLGIFSLLLKGDGGQNSILKKCIGSVGSLTKMEKKIRKKLFKTFINIFLAILARM